jgi:hypothetical protein
MQSTVQYCGTVKSWVCCVFFGKKREKIKYSKWRAKQAELHRQKEDLLL